MPGPDFPSPIGSGTRIGPYEVIAWLGAGGMGDVYRARDARLGRDVALKLIAGASAADPSRVHRFEQEARAAGQINHPNILSVYDVGVHDGVPFIVSELLEGESLRNRLQKSAIPLRKAVDYARQAAEALASAHEKGVVHRDIKPDNLFLTADGRLKILDFGIAKLRAADDAHGGPGALTNTAEGTVVGTAGYMSPEQVRGEPVDGRSDIFSLGAVIYEMVTGRQAFSRPTAAETMTAVLKDDPPDATSAQAPPALTRIIARCLEKPREARFQSARDLAFGLDVLSGTQPAAAIAPAHSRWRLALVAAVAGAVLLAALALWKSWPAEPDARDALAGATFTQFTDFEGSETDAAISPDGKFVAFMSDRDGPFQAWLKQVGTGEFVNLTPGRPDQRNIGPNRAVGFSGEGTEVWLAGSANRRLTLVPLTAGAPRVFLPDKTVNVTWSPDGSRLAYFTYEGDPIVVADGNGDHEKRIVAAKDGDHNHFLAFSPDGRWIYYTHGNQSLTELDIWRVPAAGGTPERMTERGLDIRYVTPIDDRTVLFVAPDTDASGPWLWALDVVQRQVHRVSPGLERYLSVAASANGRRLVATVAKSTAGIWSIPIADRIVEERDATQLAMPTARALAPRFGSGSVMFYLSSAGGGDGLWRVENGRATEIRMDAGTSIIEAPSVAPDGTRLAVVRSSGGKEHITVVSADGADARQVATSIDVRGTSSWSPDGQWIVTGGSDAQGQGLFKIPVNGGEPVRLVSGQALDPAWSPDGNFIVYLGRQAAWAPLQIIRLDGTPVPLPLIKVLSAGRGRVRFLPDSTGFIYLEGEDGALNFWRYDLATGKQTQLTRLSNPATISTFDISPDGRRIVFDRVRERGDIVLIDRRVR